MAYTITIPEDWLILHGTVWIVEYDKNTSSDKAYAAFPNRVIGFTPTGFHYRYDPSCPVYSRSFSEIGKTVFKTESECNKAVKELNKNIKRRIE